jgi:hypothetical protein
MKCQTYRKRYKSQIDDIPEPYEADDKFYFDEHAMEKADRILEEMGKHLNSCFKCQKWLARESERLVECFSRLEVDKPISDVSIRLPTSADVRRLTEVFSSRFRAMPEQYKKGLN